MLLVVIFVITLLSALIAVSGGHGIILTPSLLLLGYDIKEIIFVTRISAVVFVLFSLIAVIQEKSVPKFDFKDLLITFIACISAVLSVYFLNNLSNSNVMLFVVSVLIILLLLSIFDIVQAKHNWIFLMFLPIFAGICGSTVGGAGLIICLLYKIIGIDHCHAVKKRIIPSFVIQVITCINFLIQITPANNKLLYTVILATAIGGYLNIRLFLKLPDHISKSFFYASTVFAISILIAKAWNNISIEEFWLKP